MTSRISRRELFGGLAASTALIPLLRAENAWGAGQTYPRRILLITFTNGVIRPQFWPTGGNGRDLSTMSLPIISKSLEPYKSDLVFMRGIRAQNYRDTPGIAFRCGHYSYTSLYSGTVPKVFDPEKKLKVIATSPTIDQVIAKSVAEQTPLPIRSLHLGVKSTSGDVSDTCVFRAAETPVIPEIDPKRVFNTLFAGMNTDGTALARLKAERKSVLDFVGRDLTRFTKRLGTDDRRKVEGHLESIRALELQNNATEVSTCQGPTPPTEDPTLMVNFPKMVSAQLDLITAAFKCDLTRVATLQLTNFNGDKIGSFPWIPLIGNVAKGYHAIAHEIINYGDEYGTAGNANKIRVDTWFTEQFASVIKRFKDTPEGSGTMLDNTAILFANHMGDGKAHDVSDLPFVLAGKCGGAFKTGQNIPAPGTNMYFNTNAVWVGLAKAMGLSMNVFGDPQYGSGTLPGLMV